MLEGLRCRYAIVRVVDEQLLDEVNHFGTGLGDELGDAGALNPPHTKFCKVHMAGMSLELVEKCLFRRAEYVMYLVHLVELVITGEEWEKRDDFEHNTTDTPQVHLVTVVSIGQETFGCTIPTRGDVLCIRLLRVDTTA